MNAVLEKIAGRTTIPVEVKRFMSVELYRGRTLKLNPVQLNATFDQMDIDQQTQLTPKMVNNFAQMS